MLRILQVIIACMIIPVMCLGIMAAFSGGGMTPAFQQIGKLLLTLAPLVGIIGIIASLILQRVGVSPLAYIALAVPVIVWVGLIIWLQRATGFFTP